MNIKNFISLIMANNSHTLGSHVMHGIKNDLLNKANQKESDSESKETDNESYLKSLARAMGYFQERQAYLAKLASGYRPPMQAVNFKSAIVDELLFDEGYKSEGQTNLILQFITQSEGLDRKNIHLNFISDEDLNSVNINLPGGIIGRHALFSIIEHIIRNAAKHNSRISELTITIQLVHVDGEYQVKIWDSIGNGSKVYSAMTERMNEPLNENMNTNKGIKEMKISAALLAGVDFERSPLTIALVDENGIWNDEAQNLCYSFSLQKGIRREITKESVKDFIGIDPDECTLVIEDSSIREEQFNNKLVTVQAVADYKRDFLDKIENPNSHYLFFRTHNDTEAQFKTFIKGIKNTKIDNNLHFIEGISGHNSTDRLIRYEKQTDYWRLKLIESALAKITIIDERIYDKYAALDQEIKLTKKQKDDFFEKLAERNNNAPETKKDLVEEFKSLYPIDITDVEYSKEVIDFIEDPFIYKNDRLKMHFYGDLEILEDDLLDLKAQSKYKNILSKKNINIYNLNVDNNRLNIFNLDKIKIEKVDNLSHFIFIHQGILDKWYDVKGAKTDGEKQLSFDEFIEKIPSKQYVIHSGAGVRPDFLPKGVLFTDFSSIEHGLNDCKFTLTEHLYNLKHTNDE